MAVLQDFTETAAMWPGGLVFAIAFDGEGVGRSLSSCDAEILERAGRDGGWLWLHFNLADRRAIGFLERQGPLPAEIRALLLDDEDRHVALGAEGALGLVFSDFQTEFDGAAGFEPARLRLALGPGLVISARRHPLMGVDRVRRAVLAGRRVASPGALVGALGDAFLDAAADHIETFADRFDDIEDAVIAGLSDAGDNHVARMRRTLLRLHREISPMRSLMRRLGLLAGEFPASPAADVVKEGPRLIAALDGLDNEVRDLQARARLIREETEALASAETNRQLFILSVLSAVFLPGTLVTGLFGMNTNDLPFTHTAGGFWFALGFVALATLVVIVIIRWLGGRR